MYIYIAKVFLQLTKVYFCKTMKLYCIACTILDEVKDHFISAEINHKANYF